MHGPTCIVWANLTTFSLKLGTESRANFRDILFTDVEGSNLDRGMVLYPSDVRAVAAGHGARQSRAGGSWEHCDICIV